MEVLKAWAESEDFRILRLVDARQTGKTVSVREFGRAQFSAFLEIRFETDKEAESIFTGTVEDMVQKLELKAGRSLPASRTLILLGETPDSYAKQSALHALVQTGRWRFVQTISFPEACVPDPLDDETKQAGERTVRMMPLDFEEFLWGAGISDSTIQVLKQALRDGKEVPASLHEQMTGRFVRVYIRIKAAPVFRDSAHSKRRCRNRSLKKCISARL